jgi:hypothetical protein
MPPVEANFGGLRGKIALATRGKERTLFETSKVLGKRSGDIQRVMRRMKDEGLLNASDDEPVRGTRYWFNEAIYGNALDEFLESDRPPGQLFSDQRVLLVSPRDEEDPWQVIARGDLAGDIAWVVEWGGDGDMLIGMEKDAESRAVDQLMLVLRESGLRCRRKFVSEVMGADGVRRRAQSLDYVRNERN